MSAFEGCPLSGVPLYFQKAAVAVLILNLTCNIVRNREEGGGEICLRLIQYFNKHPLSTFASKYSTKKGKCILGYVKCLFSAQDSYYVPTVDTHADSDSDKP